VLKQQGVFISLLYSISEIKSSIISLKKMDKVPSVSYTAEEVSEWLKSNGFEAFCDKFKGEFAVNFNYYLYGI
jgi:3-methyladenine DNA glycosylase Tag